MIILTLDKIKNRQANCNYYLVTLKYQVDKRTIKKRKVGHDVPVSSDSNTDSHGDEVGELSCTTPYSYL